jgi:hypothetical protein
MSLLRLLLRYSKQKSLTTKEKFLYFKQSQYIYVQSERDPTTGQSTLPVIPKQIFPARKAPFQPFPLNE